LLCGAALAVEGFCAHAMNSSWATVVIWAEWYQGFVIPLTPAATSQVVQFDIGGWMTPMQKETHCASQLSDTPAVI